METEEQQSGSAGVTRTKTRKPVYRRIWFWLATLVVVYALVGFIALPWWLERMLPQQLEQRMGWQAQVEDIHANPFLLSVDARALTAQDQGGERVIGFDRLYVNVGFWDLLTGVVGLEAIELDEPYIRLDLLEDDGINLVRDWQRANGTDAGPTGEPMKVHFRQVDVSGGELLLRDFSQQEPAQFRITPLDLTLSDLVTWQREQSSQYRLQAALGSQELDWEGEFSMNPLYSRGRLSVTELDYQTLQHILAPYLPYVFRQGTVTASTDYELRQADQFYLTTENGSLALNNPAMAIAEDDDQPALEAAGLSVDNIRFGLTQASLELGVIEADGLKVALERNADGQIDLLAPWQSTSEDAGNNDGGSESGFQWSLAGVELAEGSLRWRDSPPGGSVDLTVNDVGLSLGAISQELEEPVRYRLQGQSSAGGSLALEGQVTLSPFTLEAGLNASELTLSVFEPYIREFANLNVRQGLLTLDGNLDLDGQQDPLTGTFSGTAELSELDVTLPDSDEPLISWQTLQLAPVEYNVHPARLEIGTVTLSNPLVNVVRGNDGLHNLERILKTAPEETPSDSEQGSDDTGEPGFIFRIEQLVLEEGRVSYTDRTLAPEFATHIASLNGSVTGASNIPPQQGRVSFRGLVGGRSELTFEGSLGTLGTDDISELTLTARDASLVNLSPYFGRYLGYSVQEGLLDLEMHYEFAGTQLDAANLIVMDGLTLGESVNSEQAVNVPVKLGLALLRDSQGEIEIDLPISGDLSDPEFNLGRIMMRGVVNLISKAAASPFSVLGSVAKLAGLTDEELRDIDFMAGRVELSEGETSKLEGLAEALKQRPALALTIRGAASSEADGLSGDELDDLAAERGQWLKQQLVDEYGVNGEQVVLADPTNEAGASREGVVAARFDLNVR